LENKNELYSKTFMYLSLGLLITFVTGYTVSLNEVMLSNILSGGPEIIWILEIALAIFFGVKLPKMSKGEAIICYILYTFLTGLTFASIFAVFSISSIITIFLVTACIFGVLALIGIKSNKDVTSVGTILFVGLIAIIILSIINIFIGSSMLALVLTIIGVLIFLGYTIYDIKCLKVLEMVNYEVAPIYGAFELYLDFINIFINLLQLFGNSRDN